MTKIEKRSPEDVRESMRQRKLDAAVERIERSLKRYQVELRWREYDRKRGARYTRRVVKLFAYDVGDAEGRGENMARALYPEIRGRGSDPVVFVKQLPTTETAGLARRSV